MLLDESLIHGTWPAEEVFAWTSISIALRRNMAFKVVLQSAVQSSRYLPENFETFWLQAMGFLFNIFHCLFSLSFYNWNLMQKNKHFGCLSM